MKKIGDLQSATKLAQQTKAQGKKVGLITGCFDILHEGHIDLFRFAKKHVDILIIALDSDQAIKSGKGSDRPIHNQVQRAKVLSELESVDFVLPITDDYVFTKESVEPVHDKIRDAIKPDYLITAPAADAYWENKQKRAKAKGVKMLFFSRPNNSSSSSIINKISDF